jgi:GlpG protein
VVSNLGQYYFSKPNFLGFSGALYGLFGYAWIRGRFDPESGLEVNQQTVTLMLVWFALCFTGLLGPIANGAHASGLALGAIWGFAAAKLIQPRRRS